MSAFFDKHQQWSKHGKAISVRVKKSLFETGVQGTVGAFLCAGVPACPKIVCHSEHTANDFFKACISNATDPDFISVVELKAVPKRERSSGPAVYARLEQTPLSLARSDTPKKKRISTVIHVKENGDFQVIQSPARSVELFRAYSIDSTDPTSSTSDLKRICSGHMPSKFDMRFNGTEESWRPFVGVSFHVGELIVDAEVHRMPSRAPTRIDERETSCCLAFITLPWFNFRRHQWRKSGEEAIRCT
jgi:hypothetical protein